MLLACSDDTTAPDGAEAQVIQLTCQPPPPPVDGLEPASVELQADPELVLPNLLAVEGKLPKGFSSRHLTWGCEGPGKVYLSAPNRAQTQAAFTVPGAYNIYLAAKKGDRGGVAKHSVQVHRAKQFTAVLEGQFDIHWRANLGGGTRLVTVDGDIYVAFVDDQVFEQDEKERARTIIAHKKLGQEDWETAVIDPDTRVDGYHGFPSIGVDGNRHIHVTYDMHGDPWQYKVSTRPRDISEWEFKGQELGKEEKLNGGTAAVPGNQITYPEMLSQPDGTLYLGYRECTDCDHSNFFLRKWSGGLSQYDPALEQWSRVGGVRPFAQGDDYRPQYLKAFRDIHGRTHLAWVWGQQYANGTAGPYFDFPNYPAYAYTDDGATFHRADGSMLTLPLRRETSDIVADPALIHPDLGEHDFGYFSAVNSVSIDRKRRPYVVTAGHFFYYDPSSGWLNQFDDKNKVPWSGMLRTNHDGEFIVFSGGKPGVRVHVSADARNWEQDKFAFDEEDSPDGYATRIDERYLLETGQFRVLTAKETSDGRGWIKVWTVHLPDL